ncbi:MAG: UvrB/UvrC motif-containing protein [Lachnospiraceae bacterium]|nr:UvrB/UvrC motif-containing protein [Lachnospiraceae bacterium]
MLCERCRQREATVRFTEVVNGVSSEHHFCLACAREMDFGPYSAILENFPMEWLLSGLLGIGGGEGAEQEEAPQTRFEITCPTCGTTYSQFVKDSRFGCADCYGVFDLLIGENMKHIHGAERHTGKKPRMRAGSAAAKAARAGAKETREETLQILRSKLKEALREEQYEDAARLRDEIRSLSGGDAQ